MGIKIEPTSLYQMKIKGENAGYKVLSSIISPGWVLVIIVMMVWMERQNSRIIHVPLHSLDSLVGTEN